MKIIMQILLILSLGIFQAQAQSSQGKIKGQLTDQTTKEALPAATVVLLHSKDSSVANTAISDNKGNFEISGIADGSYRIYLSFMGYKAVYKPVTINADNRTINLGNLAMEHKGVDLAGVEIVQEKPPIVVKKDTLEFNADAFKTRENSVVEDLLKKLPGVVVDKDGGITAQGQTVNKVLVNGKPFFGSDPKMATRNLPANIIDKVQLIDKKSDQAEFTQIDDGQTEKAINIVIKKDKNKGLFGRGTAGYGTDDRYGVSFNLNRFNDDQKISLVGNANNVNNLGFSAQNQMSFGRGGGGGGGGGSRRGFASGGATTVNPGITTSSMAGFNYMQTFNKKLDFSGSYLFNDNKVNILQNTTQQNIQANYSNYQYTNSASSTDNLNHRVNMRFEYQLDSLHSFIFTPTYSLTNANSNSVNAYTTLGNNNKDTINRGVTYNDGHGNSANYGGNLLFRKRFNKKGRSLSLNLSYNNSTNNQVGTVISNTMFLNDNVRKDSSYNQENTTDSYSKNLGANLTYSEPLSKDRYLEVNYGITKYHSYSERYTYDYDSAKLGYTKRNDSLSNIFTNNTVNQQAGIAIRTVKLKYDYAFGLNVLFNNLDNNTFAYRTLKDSLITQNTVNFSPNANFNYMFSKNKRLRINYNGNTTQPTIQQLQPVPDNSDALYIQQGNPNLKPAFNNTIQVNYNTFNMNTFRGAFIMFTSNFGSNKIINAINYDSTTGKTITMPVNVNGYYSFSGMMHNSIPLSKTPGQNLNTATNISYGRDVSINNALKNFSTNIVLGQAANVSFMVKDWLDLSAGGNISYNITRYTITKSSNGNYLNYGATGDVNVTLPKGFMIGSDINYTMNSGLSNGNNLTSTLWNANVAKYVFPKRTGLIKFQAFDLLHQYAAVSRTVTDNYIKDSRSNVLQQYFMLSFTYFLNRFGGQSQNSNRDKMQRDMDRNMRMYQNGGGRGGGGGFRPGGF
ncbi:outer membrane beta-barrel protein [Chitinophaga sp. Cy-1792]|uniref:outer membrane beta-barrel protein n=1 Tax=Chitinophaga sp. Cy-1792 TaxID=2608339 RepID=UPI001422355E|nr:outer membrane beta-barrel protein [Chitinophaga sp. Cy-1792]NIG52452.1 outer membrane beta-barrel protein [Chitinophaga sp. Cy-1792]